MVRTLTSTEKRKSQGKKWTNLRIIYNQCLIDHWNMYSCKWQFFLTREWGNRLVLSGKSSSLALGNPHTCCPRVFATDSCSKLIQFYRDHGLQKPWHRSVREGWQVSRRALSAARSTDVSTFTVECDVVKTVKKQTFGSKREALNARITLHACILNII
jgi:hypothetical protein